MASTSARSSTGTEPPWLRAERLGYRYGDRIALSELDCELWAHRVAVVGRNGSGKSTLLALCAGRLRVGSGTLTVLGQPAGRRSLAARTGYAAQRPELDPDMNGQELMDTFSALFGLAHGEQRRVRQAELEERFQLQEFVRRRVSQYSGGMRRRLHLAISLLHRPALWIVDEPDAGLDAEGRLALWKEVDARAARGEHTLFAAHRASEVVQHADHVMVLEAGRLTRAASMHELNGAPGGAEAVLAAWMGAETGREKGRLRD